MFTTWFSVPVGNYRWSGREPSTFMSSPGARRMFCPACGTPMAYEHDRYPGETHFYVASMENPAAFVPQFHVFYAEKLPWVMIADDLPKHAGTGSDGA